MNDTDRYKVLLGHYKAPRFRVGQVVRCEVRGEVRVVGVSEGLVSWPVGIKASNRALVVYKGLAKAVRRESAQAVAHWWGVHR
jgi:hypothetical protein